MSTKHLYNTTEGLVSKSLQGAIHLNPSLRFHAPSRSVYIHESHPRTETKTPHNNNQITVSVISGGGAGHEPAHAGYTGHGMLSASISGDVFASPSARSITQTIQLASNVGKTKTSSSRAVLVIINNYTGDRLNFGLAIEKSRNRGISVDSVVVADDVSLLGRPENAVVGPRGLAGNVLVCKILGAAAERGMELGELKRLGDVVVGNLKSVGVGLDGCHVPGRTWGERLGEGEVEVGLGLHNERGVERRKVPREPGELLEEMVEMVQRSRVVESGDGEMFVKRDEDCVLFVNNLGGMSLLEMGAVVKDLVDILHKRFIHPKRILSSSYMTSLNAPGFSISLLNVSKIHDAISGDMNINVISLIDDPTDAVAWVGSTRQHQYLDDAALQREEQEQASERPSAHQIRNDEGVRSAYPPLSEPLAAKISRGITAACNAVLAVQEEMTKFDSVVGDGDCGDTFAKGARAILDSNLQTQVSQLSLPELVQRIGDILEDNMGGTIGALFAIFFTAWSSAFSSRKTQSSHSISDGFKDVHETLSKALTSLSHHTPAKPGDRTVMDALVPFCEALSLEANFADAVNKAREGAESTRGMKAKLGRAVYVGTCHGGQEEEIPPDPGAWGVVAILEGFCEGVS
ncbi:DAK1/DegV-like protein [Marasmius fiardii PR-910]|nr:DAK1/DegV-like protein [Marasmius fiardii PR-910]